MSNEEIKEMLDAWDRVFGEEKESFWTKLKKWFRR